MHNFRLPRKAYWAAQKLAETNGGVHEMTCVCVCGEKRLVTVEFKEA